MLAFSLLECGQMEDAEKAAKRGFEINKQDCWSQHAVSKNYYICKTNTNSLFFRFQPNVSAYLCIHSPYS